MIKAAIEKILDLAAPNIYDHNGESYTDKPLNRIDKELRAREIGMSNLSSLVSYIKNTSDMKTEQYIILVSSPTEVVLMSALDSDRAREVLVEVTAEVPTFRFDTYIPNENFIVGVQSKFCDGSANNANDKALILKFAGNVKSGTVAEYGDTGVGQKATVKMGAASLSEVEVPSPCHLQPYRTFTEVEQPASDFIFRLRDGRDGGVEFALFEADGGAWKNEAKKNIKEYLEKELSDISNIFIIS